MKSLSVLTEYLIYISLAIGLLSIVLYHVYIFSGDQKTRITTYSIQNILDNINYNFQQAYSCYQCLILYQSNLPEGSSIYFYNNSNIISILAITDKNCSYYLNEKYINLNVSKYGTKYLCNFTINTYPYFTQNTKNITQYKYVCIYLNKTPNNLYIYSC